MHLSIHIEREINPEGRSGPATVGWFLDAPKASVIFDAPTRVHSRDALRTHGKSASRCPATLNAETRYFEVKCPFDINVAFERSEKGKPILRNLSEEASSIRAKKLFEVLFIVNENEWRFQDRPTLQLALPYVFVSDDPVYLSQLPPFFHYRKEQWPGTLFAGRFPVDVWPRVIFWAFEWHDISKPLVLRRGEPLFYLYFETLPQDRPVHLIEVEKTKELMEYYDSISGVTNYVNQTFSLFKTAEERRPKKLITLLSK